MPDVGDDATRLDAVQDASCPDAVVDGSTSDAAADASQADASPPDGGEPPKPKGPDFLAEEPEHWVVRAHHVRYQVERADGDWIWQEHEHFPFWVEAPPTMRHNMFVSEVWRPERAEDVRHVVLLAAGQQGMRQVASAVANIATGQEDGWRPEGIDRRVRDYELRLRKQSVAGELILDGLQGGGSRFGFSPGDTLLLLAYDAGFNYMLSVEDKEAVEAGYVAWLRERLRPMGTEQAAMVESFFLGGSSRGGCLALRVADRVLRNPDHEQARVLVGLLDPVAHEGQREVGVSAEEPLPNPLNGELEVWRTDLASYLPESGFQRLALAEVVGGGPVIDLGIVGMVHSFVDGRGATEGPAVLPFSYRLIWVDRPHTDIGRPWHDDTAGALLVWLQEQLS